MEIHTKESSKQNNNADNLGFGTAAMITVSMVIFSIVAQNSVNWVSNNMLKVGLPIIIFTLFIGISYKHLIRIIATPYFAITSLLSIALGTAIGTFITQNALPYNFAQRYGEKGSQVLEFLQFHDIFHSWWYIGFFVLMAGSLFMISIKKGFGKATWSFHLAHLSPIIIIFGFWIDYYHGFRGIISLEVDQVTNEATIYKGQTSIPKGMKELPFQLRLDQFEFEKYDPDYRVQIWKDNADEYSQTMPDGSSNIQKAPKINASFPLEEKKVHRIYGTDVRFWLLDVYPNFTFVYSYPNNIDTIPPSDPGILIDLKTKVGENTLQLRQNREGQGKLSDPSLGASLEFYWDPPDEAFIPIEKETVDTSFAAAHAQWADMGRIIFSGIDKQIYFVKEDEVDKVPMEPGKFYSFPGKKDEGFSIKYLFPDAKYLKSIPATKNKDLENPVAKVQIWSEKINPAQTAYIYPGMNRRGGTYSVPDSDYFLALESFKGMETKYWKSDLTVLDDEGKELKSQSIVVNEPMLFNGYRLYQSDYDPNNPAYSGIGVSYAPGLYIVYGGFVLMVIGTIMLFYLRTKFENNNQMTSVL